MNPEIDAILAQMSKLAPPRDVPLSNPDVVHTYQSLYAARLSVLIAKEIKGSADVLIESSRKLENYSVRVISLTWALVWLTVGLFIFTVFLAIHEYRMPPHDQHGQPGAQQHPPNRR